MMEPRLLQFASGQSLSVVYPLRFERFPGNLRTKEQRLLGDTLAMKVERNGAPW